MGAVFGIGLLLTVILFFVRPEAGVGLFIVLWVGGLLSAIIYHVTNAAGRRGVDTTEFHFQADPPPAPNTPTAAGAAGDFEARLRKLESLRSDGLISESEYATKRAEILRTPW